MTDSHLESVEAIDMACGMNFEKTPFLVHTKKYVGRMLKRKGKHPVRGMVSVLDGVVAGFVIYQLLPHEYFIKRIAVNPMLHRNGIGTQMMNKLFLRLAKSMDRTNSGLRHRLSANIVDDNDMAPGFFRSLGMRHVQTCGKVHRYLKLSMIDLGCHEDEAVE